MEKNKTWSKQKKITIAAISVLGLLMLTWCTMLYNDYDLVINRYAKPAFCINFDQAYQEYRALTNATSEEYDRKIEERYLMDYGYFEGLGYSVELSGAFFPFDPENVKPEYNYDTGELLNPFPGVLQARFYILGREVATVNREYPEDANRSQEWVLQDIFS